MSQAFQIEITKKIIHFRIPNLENEPPYAVLNTRDFDEEEEEGYETIPASDSRTGNGRKDSQEVSAGWRHWLI